VLSDAFIELVEGHIAFSKIVGVYSATYVNSYDGRNDIFVARGRETHRCFLTKVHIRHNTHPSVRKQWMIQVLKNLVSAIFFQSGGVDYRLIVFSVYPYHVCPDLEHSMLRFETLSMQTKK